MKTPTTLIVCPIPLVSRGLRSFFARDLGAPCCLEAGSPLAALDLPPAPAPGLIVFAPACLGEGTPRLIQELHRGWPGVPVVLVGTAPHPELYRRLRLAGVNAVVTLEDGTDEVALGVEAALRGSHYMSAHATCEELRGGAHSTRQAAALGQLRLLSNRESEVFELAGQRLPLKEIAAQLNISIKTVETHRMRIKEKLGLAHLADLTRAAAEHASHRRPAVRH
jgi:DNA-binding NarL/FixJ family response regulator